MYHRFEAFPSKGSLDRVERDQEELSAARATLQILLPIFLDLFFSLSRFEFGQKEELYPH